MRNFLLGFVLASGIACGLVYADVISGIYGIAAKDSGGIWRHLSVDAAGNLEVVCS